MFCSLHTCFAMSSFTVNYEPMINNCGIYSFIASREVYHKICVAAHPTKNSQGEFEWPQYGQIYFLDNDDAVSVQFNNPINHVICKSLVNLLEQIIWSHTAFSEGFMMMWEVEANQHAVLGGNVPSYIKFWFTLSEGIDYWIFNIPFQNEVCTVFTLNAN